MQSEEPLRRIVKRFRGGLVCKVHGLSYHSTLGSKVIEKKKKSVLLSCETRKRMESWKALKALSPSSITHPTTPCSPHDGSTRFPSGHAMGQTHAALEAIQGQCFFRVSSHTNATSKGWHLLEFDLKFASTQLHGGRGSQPVSPS